MLLLITLQTSFAQHTSRDSYTGLWESTSSWNPQWAVPVRDSINVDITINGYITASGKLTFKNDPANLIINDTLVIYGGLSLSNRNQLIINDGGILIVKGDITISNKTEIQANGYLIVTGNVLKDGSLLQGAALSNDVPEKVFVTGSVAPILNGYPLFYLTVPSSAQHAASGYAYGNAIDLANDPIYSFLMITCKRKADGSTGVCTGGDISLHAEGGTSYNWTGPGGFTSNLQSPVITNAGDVATGIYSVVIDGGECGQETKQVSITVNAIPAAIISCPAGICTGSAINLSSAGGVSYSWTGPAGFTSNEQNPVIPAAVAGMSGTYTVKVTNEKNCSSLASANLIVNPLPDVTASSNSPLCFGSSLSLTSTGGTSYRWTGPDGFTSSLQSPVLTDAGVNKTGLYKVVVTDVNKCSAEKEVNVTVNALPVPIVPAVNSFCAGDAITLTCSGGTTYKWTGPGGFTCDLASLTIPAADISRAGTYEVTVTDQNICSDKASVQVEVKPLPKVQISLTTDHVCSGEKVVLSGNPDGGMFSLKNGRGDLSGNIFSTTNPGIVELKYTYDNGCRNEITQSLVVLERPFSEPGPDQTLDFLFETNMAAEWREGWQGTWSVVAGTGIIIDNEHSPTAKISGLSIGENILRWTVTNGYCEESRELIIRVKDLLMPSVITPNNDGRNDRLVLPESMKNVAFTVFNRWGMIEFSSNNYQVAWDGRNSRGKELPEDTYFYILDSGTGILRKGSISIIR